MAGFLYKAKSKWNLANLFTFSRILVTPFFLFFIFRDELWTKWTAGLLFAWGAISDYIDGYVARKYKLMSVFGMLMDPLADKILLLSVFVSFAVLGLAPTWMVVIIAGREFLITGLRQVAQSQNIIIAASRAGKHKTVSQIVAISVILTIVCVRATVETYQSKWDVFVAQLGMLGDWLDKFIHYGPKFFMLYATVMSILSGIDYLYNNRHVWGVDKK